MLYNINKANKKNTQESKRAANNSVLSTNIKKKKIEQASE